MFDIDKVNKMITIDIRISPEFLLLVLLIYLAINFVIYALENDFFQKIILIAKNKINNKKGNKK